jgi:hypothetical protein
MIEKPQAMVAMTMKLGARTGLEMTKCRYAGSGSMGGQEPWQRVVNYSNMSEFPRY